MAILWGVQGNSCCCVLKLPHPSAGWGQFCAHWKKCRFPSAAGSDLIGKNVFLYLGAGALGGAGPIAFGLCAAVTEERLMLPYWFFFHMACFATALTEARLRLRYWFCTHNLLAPRGNNNPKLSLLGGKSAPMTSYFWQRVQSGWMTRCCENEEATFKAVHLPMVLESGRNSSCRTFSKHLNK